MGYLIDIIPIGILSLIIYIIIDCFKHKTANLLRRVILYSFIIYVLFVFQHTTGGFHYPPRHEFFGTVIVQLHPFQFVSDWINLYQRRGLDWSFWNSVKLTLFNMIMLLPLGVYLKVFFNKKHIKKATIIVLIVSVVIETYQIILSYFGLILLRAFDVDDIMINTIGGAVGYYVSSVILKRLFPKLLLEKYRGKETKSY